MLVNSRPRLTQRNDWLRDIFCLCAALFVFYSLWLGSYPLFTPDEGRYSEVAREMIAANDYITPRVNGVAFLDKPILYYWLQATAIHLFGIKEWALRFFPMLFGIIGCAMTYLCGRHLFNRRTGLISAIILATTPLYFGGAHYANLDLEVAVLISCTLLCFLTAIQGNSSHRSLFLLAAYLFAGLAVLTKGLIGVAFPSMIAGTWIILLWRWSILKKIHLSTGIILFLMLVLPWYILVQKANPEFLHYFFVTQHVTRFLSGGEFNNKTPFWFYLPIVLIGFFPWTIFLVQAINKQICNVWKSRQQHATELFLLLWFFIVFIFFSIPHSKIIGYILPVFPALALLVGHYLSEEWEKAQQKGIYWAFVNFILLGLMLAVGLFLLPHRGWTDISPAITPHATLIACTFLISAIASLLFIKKEKLLPLFVTCVSCSIIFLLTLVWSAPHLNQNSAKLLVDYLKTVAQPQDEVITYFKYYHDVPLYLGQRVTIVADWNSPDIAYKDNWRRELWYGMAFQNTDEWLINEDTFWQRFESDKRVFVFINENYLEQFKAHAKSYFILDRRNDIILISNKPIFLSASSHGAYFHIAARI